MIKNPFKVAKARILKNLETFRRMIMLGPIGAKIKEYEADKNREPEAACCERAEEQELEATDGNIIVDIG